MSTVSARLADDGLSVTCGCGTTIGLPLAGGEDTCPCGMHHAYDGKTLLSRPAEAPAVIKPASGRVHASDPRRSAPPRGESGPL